MLQPIHSILGKHTSMKKMQTNERLDCRPSFLQNTPDCIILVVRKVLNLFNILLYLPVLRCESTCLEWQSQRAGFLVWREHPHGVSPALQESKIDKITLIILLPSLNNFTRLGPKGGRVRNTIGTTTKDIIDDGPCDCDIPFNWWQEMTDQFITANHHV
jgi:hypothetical protein